MIPLVFPPSPPAAVTRPLQFRGCGLPREVAAQERRPPGCRRLERPQVDQLELLVLESFLVIGGGGPVIHEQTRKSHISYRKTG